MTPLLNLILLVDDDETTNHVNKRLLTKLNIAREIKTFGNGKDALAYLRLACGPDKTEETICPDLVFLDIRMPVMDGFDFLDAYEKEAPATIDPVIILMLSSSASFYDLERLKSYRSVKKHLSKALTPTDVKDIVAEYFSPN